MMKSLIFFPLFIFYQPCIGQEKKSCSVIKTLGNPVTITFRDSMIVDVDGKIVLFGNVRIKSDYEISGAEWVKFHSKDSITIFDPTGNGGSMPMGVLMPIANEKRKHQVDINLKTRKSKIYY